MPVREMLDTFPAETRLDREQTAEVVRTLIECAQACTACADACLSEQQLDSLRTCIRLNLDCADICEVTARVLSRQTGFDAEVARALLQACAQACTSCAQECERHADMHEHCRIWRRAAANAGSTASPCSTRSADRQATERAAAVQVLSAVWDALYTGAGFFWKAFWALGLGYAISAGIQVFVSRSQAAEHLGGPRPRPVGLAMVMGFASSSCSFAALSATRSLYTKGAHLITALAFMFASSNLAVEVAALAWIFLGWQYALALFVGAPILVTVMAGLVRLTKPERLASAAREHAREVEGQHMEPSRGLPERFADRFRSVEAWHRVGRSYRMEWGMVWRDLLIGFAVAGAVAALVPAAFFQAIFPTGWPIWLELPVQALTAPVLAVLTFIGSMGNGPVAAVLAGHGVVFGAIMVFLFADFVVPPALRINARYYGWRFATYLAAIFAASAVLAGIVVHALFGLVGLLPEQAKPATELASFAIDYTFWLNLLTLAVGTSLVVLGRRGQRRQRERSPGR